jgi:methenyltetrahydromethanopterin cyclohydrolase
MADAPHRPSLNTLTAPLVAALIGDAVPLRIGVESLAGGTTVVDAGIAFPGSLEAGRRIAEICLGGIGWVDLVPNPASAAWPWQVQTRSAQPVLACLASQLAGWELAEGDFFALGSGPGRAAAGTEKLFDEIGYRDMAASACLVLEVDRTPPPALVARIAEACGVAESALTLVLTPTRSLAGTVQIVGRVLEVAMHKVHQIHFPLDRVVDGMGAAPLPPPAPDFMTAMGRTNDAIIFGGTVQLYVTGPDDEARDLAEKLPSRTSRDYGQPFADVFRGVEGNFYRIDPLLFSPARVVVTNLDSGRTFHAGACDDALIDASFGRA